MDYIIQKERELRIAAEESLPKYLVDIYNNPDVNSELCLRLPHAKRSHTPSYTPEILTGSSQLISGVEDRHTLQRGNVGRSNEHVAEFSNQFEPASNMDLENSITCMSDMASLSQPLTAPSGGSQDGSSHQTHHSTYQQSVRPRRRLPDCHPTNGYLDKLHNGYSVKDGQEPEVWSTLNSAYQLLPPYSSPTINNSPFSPVDWSSSESSVYQCLPLKHEQRGHQGHETESRLRRERNDQIQLLSGNQTTARILPTSNTSRLPKPQLISSHSTSLPSLHNIEGPSQPYVRPADYLPISNSRRASTSYLADPVSHMSRLLAEIATLKKQNEELREKLRGTRPEGRLLTNNAKSTEDLSHFGDHIEEIHNDERKLHMTVKSLGGATDKDNANFLEEEQNLGKKYVSKSVQADALYDSEFSEADDFEDGPASTSEMTDSGDNTHKVQYKRKNIERLVARQREIMKEEMQKVLDERNIARQRVLKLEKKLASLELSHFTDNRASTLLAKLRVTERERDLAVSRLKFMAHDVGETKLMYNLHKALLSDDPTNHTSTYQEFKKSNINTEPTKNSMADIRSKETEEKAKLEARIALIEKEKRSQSNHIDKLEQLVKRQRQKLNSLCAGPMLMND